LFIIDKFKDRIKELCGQYGISQKFLCDQIGKQKTYFNDVWRGRCTPTDGDLQTIANHLHTTPAYLRGETDDPAPAEYDGDSQRERVIKRITSLSTDDLLKLEKIIDMLEEK
jgi:transcriptional regulator with XRE-family HTH domain